MSVSASFSVSGSPLGISIDRKSASKMLVLDMLILLQNRASMAQASFALSVTFF